MPASDWRDPEQWPDDLKAAFGTLPRQGRWHLALSGGLDSVFLLHCITALATAEGRALNAIHINHGLQPEAEEWESQCQALCRELGVSFQNHSLALDPNRPDLEARARQARYDVFEQALEPEDTLFMAHHGDDQAETVLLRLLRGSGVRGLAGMPASRSLGAGQLHRPLLPLTRARIEALAREWQLDWCEDHSNNNTRFDRNYLRHQVMPLLKERWPEAVSRFNRSADHCREADELLDELARQDAEAVTAGEGVSVAHIRELTNPRRQQLIRYLLRLNGLQPPGEKRLQTGLDALLTAPPDGAPELRGEDYRLCRFRDRLWIVPELPDIHPSASAPWHPDQPMDWFGTILEAHRYRGVGIAVPRAGELTVAPRRGGERIQTRPEQPERPLKKWLQEQGIPPWERQRLPLIWHRDELVAVADYWLSPCYKARSGDQGWQLVWHRPWRLLRSR
ncbi:tRNA(Ile)-lysidine synthase [Halospina denitrificans]|uniref:tRNA(Ile)-lysidine synthase n=2 Tax=Halospina denitrificans TaxID=332522 RepID=A0A4R7JL77_9GAMM|nr:tRNA(Ile)-lysidine synthase [Halospina denitrificans]